MNSAKLSDATSSPFRPSLSAAYFLSIAAILQGGHTGRIRPGGPFISLTGDVLPATCAVIAIGFALLLLQSHSLHIRLNALISILIASLALGFIYIDIMRFWTNPIARGDLLGI